MSFTLNDILKANTQYKQFKLQEHPMHHERFIFPLFSGTYFCYRKIDILRIVAIAKTLSQNPTFVDIGCGNGDFLRKVRTYLPNAVGIEQNLTIFYILNKQKPAYIISWPLELSDLEKYSFDIAFVGWMQPGTDFRAYVSKLSGCIITTFDSGGQCGINGGCEYEEFGFQKIASWRTPSWIDVNTELMNKFYSYHLKSNLNFLSNLRTANNLWYVYSKPEQSAKIINSLKNHFITEEKNMISKKRYDFEDLLDASGFHYGEKLLLQSSKRNLWKLEFHEE